LWPIRSAGPSAACRPRVAVAGLYFLVGPLAENPRRVGKALRGDLRGLHGARVGAYRVVYEIEEEARIMRVLFADHRADVYRHRW
jgi:mRNA interferase RelE/StbE